MVFTQTHLMPTRAVSIPPPYAATFLSNFLYGIRTDSKTKPDAVKMRESLALALSVLG